MQGKELFDECGGGWRAGWPACAVHAGYPVSSAQSTKLHKAGDSPVDGACRGPDAKNRVFGRGPRRYWRSGQMRGMLELQQSVEFEQYPQSTQMAALLRSRAHRASLHRGLLVQHGGHRHVPLDIQCSISKRDLLHNRWCLRQLYFWRFAFLSSRHSFLLLNSASISSRFSMVHRYLRWGLSREPPEGLIRISTGSLAN